MPALPIYTTPAIRKLEELAAPAAGHLMERAGAAAAEFARDLCGDTAKAILVVAGPGNNGGDAFEVAARLKHWFFRVSAVFSGERDKLPKDALAALGKWETAGGTLLREIPGESRFDLAVDGLFGAGLKRPLAGAHGALVEKLNALGVPILALDVPSGIDADTGAIMGCAVRASHTLTFIAHKPGLLTLEGQQSGLMSDEGEGVACANCAAHDRAGIRVDAAGNVESEDRHAERIELLDQRAMSSRERALQSGAEQAVDGEIEARFSRNFAEERPSRGFPFA